MPDIFDVSGCSLRFYCAQDWNTLVSTIDPNIKFCKECGHNVKYCETFEEFDEMAQAGHCVAFRTFTHEQTEDPNAFLPHVTVGIPIVRKKTNK